MNKLKTLLLITCGLFPVLGNSQIISTNVDTSAGPATLHIVVGGPDLYWSDVTFVPLGDPNNTVNIVFEWVGCPVDNAIHYKDTVVNIPATFPFDLRIYVIWDTLLAVCPYPAESMLMDSLYLTADQILDVVDVGLPDDGVAVFPDAMGFLHLRYPPGANIASIGIYNAQGALVAAYTSPVDHVPIDRLARGVYVLRVLTDEKTFAKKFVVK